MWSAAIIILSLILAFALVLVAIGCYEFYVEHTHEMKLSDELHLKHLSDINKK